MRHLRLSAVLSALCLVVLAGCASAPESDRPLPPPNADFHLIMGELALARGEPGVAMEQYAVAIDRLDDAGVARRATLLALHAGDDDIARAAAERWQALAPEDHEVASFQALLHAREGRTEQALDDLSRMVDAGSDAAVSANLQHATALLAGEANRWRAASLMAALAATRPGHAEDWHGAALLALEADRPALALEYAERALALDPNHLDAMFLRARAQLETEPAQVERALAPLAGFRNAKDSGQRYRYASLLVMAGREAEADALYEDILLGEPDQHDARIARALLALEAGRLDDAEMELHTLLSRHGRVQDALFYLGALSERRGHVNDAVEWYARVAPMTPRWLDAQTAVGRVLLEQGDVEIAAQFFDEQRAQWPELELALTVNEAALLTAAGHPERALAVIRAHPDAIEREHPELRWQEALAAAESGDVARAEAVLRTELAKDPGNPILENALGYLLIEQPERRAEADALLRSALKAAPANAAVLDSAGWLRYHEGRIELARDLLEESWRREPSPATGTHLLTVLEAQNDAAAANALRAELRARFPYVFDDEDLG